MRFTRLGRAGALALAVLVLATAPAVAEDPAEADGAGPIELAPTWEADSFLNSAELTPAGLRGKLVFIEFFGTG